jgi:hypothetical protein
MVCSLGTLGELPSIFWTLACEAVSAFDLTAEHAEKNGNGFTAEHAENNKNDGQIGEKRQRPSDWGKTEMPRNSRRSFCFFRKKQRHKLFSLFFTHP